jgi:hypothetical protein
MNSQFRVMAALLVVFLLIAFGPILSAALASGIGHALGCQVDEGNPHLCMLAGFDISELLYNMFTVFWFEFLTLPWGLGMLLIWSIVAMVMYARWEDPADR